MLCDEGKGGAVDVVVELVVAAGGGENDVGIPFHRLLQNEVGGGIAGVKRDDEVDLLLDAVLADVAREEGKPVEVKLFRHVVAVVDDVTLEIHARHDDASSQDVCEIVVRREGEIAFSAAEVADAERTARQLVLDISLNKDYAPKHMVASNECGTCFFALSASAPSWLYGKDWNLIKLTRRGVDAASERIDVECRYSFFRIVIR